MRRLALLLPLLLAWPAHALDHFEIQVYDDDLNAPGHAGLEVHTNVTLAGRRTPEYPGEVPPHHVARVTLEPAVGVTEWLELGAYLHFFGSPAEGLQWGGAKVRAKFALPRREGSPLHVGLNAEVGRVPASVEQAGWANEFRPIVAWDDGRWHFGVNPIFGYALSGPHAFEPEFEPCGKVAWNTQKGFALGVEYYAGLGLMSEGFSHLRQQDHLVFAVLDLAPPQGAAEDPHAWELNLAVGHGLTAATGTDWVVKSIVGRSF